MKKTLYCDHCRSLYSVPRTKYDRYLTVYGCEPPHTSCPSPQGRKRERQDQRQQRRPSHPRAIPRCGRCGAAVARIVPRHLGGDGLCGWCRRGRSPDPYSQFPCPECGTPRWCRKSLASRSCRRCRIKHSHSSPAPHSTPPTLPVATPPDPYGCTRVVYPCHHVLYTNSPLDSLTSRTCPTCHVSYPSVRVSTAPPRPRRPFLEGHHPER